MSAHPLNWLGEDAERRFSVAAHCLALGLVVAPVGYSATSRSGVYADLRRDIWAPTPLNSIRFERYREILLHSCADAVGLDILTGQRAGLVAVHYWQSRAEHVLPATPAVLRAFSGGAYYLYRHPGGRVASGYRFVSPFPDALLVKILGEYEAIPVWAGAIDDVFKWPARDELPVHDPSCIASWAVKR